jgi:hypothetical protein
MLNNDTVNWDEVAKICPEALVMWDVNGGHEWLGTRSGPRLRIDLLHKQVVAFVGRYSALDEYTWDTWDYAIFRYEHEKTWILGRDKIIRFSSIQV